MKKYFLNKMSTGKRLAKRSIIGTRVCAQGDDGIWYSGVIVSVKTPSNPRENSNCINLTPNTRYSVRFDQKDIKNVGLAREFRDTELIGPGFKSIMDVKLKPGQKVYLTYNGRESAGEVILHDDLKDEVTVKIHSNGPEAPIELSKRLEEVRLLESRRSARLANQDGDTDFARLADMAGDRRRQSHSIDVPFSLTQNGSRKRRPSYSQDDREYILHMNDDDPMDECNAALVLMSLSCSPNSPVITGWETILGTSSGSSNTSWSTGSTSPPLSDDGHTPTTNDIVIRGARTTSISTSDEGIVMDYNEDLPRKRRASQPLYKCTWKGCGVIYAACSDIQAHIRKTHLGPRKQDDDSDEEDFYFMELEDEPEKSPSPPSPPTLSHRDMARPPHEDPEYQRQIVGNYRQGLLSLTQQQQQQQMAAIKPPLPVSATNLNLSPLIHHNYTWSQVSPTSPQKHVRLSPRPATAYHPYPSPTYTTLQVNHVHLSPNHSIQNPALATTGGTTITANTISMNAPQNGHTTSVTHRSPVSPNRRTRGENKKCRKVYGMDNKDLWCTQCKWKKACSRFGD